MEEEHDYEEQATSYHLCLLVCTNTVSVSVGLGPPHDATWTNI